MNIFNVFKWNLWTRMVGAQTSSKKIWKIVFCIAAHRSKFENSFQPFNLAYRLGVVRLFTGNLRFCRGSDWWCRMTNGECRYSKSVNGISELEWQGHKRHQKIKKIAFCIARHRSKFDDSFQPLNVAYWIGPARLFLGNLRFLVGSVGCCRVTKWRMQILKVCKWNLWNGTAGAQTSS